MPTVLTSSSTSQTATFSETLTTTTMHDGTIRVHLTGGATATLTSYTPAATGSGSTKRNGAAINLPGNAQAAGAPVQPLDGRYNYATNHEVALPQTCQAGDVIIIGKSTGEGIGLSPVTRTGYWSVPGDSIIDEMFLIEFVNFAPSASAPLRMMGLGGGRLIRQLRASANYLESQIDLSKLPTTIDLSALSGVTVPSFSTMAGLFDKFCGRISDSWSGRYTSPNLQDPGYGSHNAAAISQAEVMLCSTDTQATKLPLARALVQRGLDLAGAYLDGRYTFPNGGNILGDKSLIILAGYLLGIPALQNPDRSLGRDVFAESNRCVRFQPNYVEPDGDLEQASPDAWWFGTPEWPYRWDFLPNDGEAYQRFAPSNWSLYSQTGHSSQEFRINYMNQCVGSMVGTVLAMKLMGLGDEMGEGVMTVTENWMDGPPSSALTELAAVSGESYLSALQWGEDFAVGQGTGLCKAAWDAHW